MIYSNQFILEGSHPRNGDRLFSGNVNCTVTTSTPNGLLRKGFVRNPDGEKVVVKHLHHNVWFRQT